MPNQHSWALNFLWDISLILALVSRIISSMISVQMQFQHRSVERLAPRWICKPISSLKLKNFSSASANPPAIRHGKDSSVSKSSNYMGSKSLKSISESRVSQSKSPSNRGAIPHSISQFSALSWPRKTVSISQAMTLLVDTSCHFGIPKSEPLDPLGGQWCTTIMMYHDTWYYMVQTPLWTMFQYVSMTELASHDGKSTRDNLYQSVQCGINSKQYNLHQLASFFSRSSCNHCNRILNWKMLI